MGIFMKKYNILVIPKKTLNGYFIKQVSLFSCHYVRKNIMLREIPLHTFTQPIYILLFVEQIFFIFEGFCGHFFAYNECECELGAVHHKTTIREA